MSLRIIGLLLLSVLIGCSCLKRLATQHVLYDTYLTQKARISMTAIETKDSLHVYDTYLTKKERLLFGDDSFVDYLKHYYEEDDDWDYCYIIKWE